MKKNISLREANQRFAQLVRDVEGGAEFVVTRRGHPVARIVSANDTRRKLTGEQRAALARTLARAEQGLISSKEAFDRAALHER